MKKFLKKYKYSIISFLILLIFCLLGYAGYRKGLFDSVESFRDYVLSWGPWAFLIFFLANIVSVVVPGVPGGVILAFGVITFGPLKGFIYNYLSVCLGCLTDFLISRTFGQRVVVKIIGENSFNKYKDRIQKDTYQKFLIISMLLPLGPNNILSYLSGLSNMSFRKFALIVFLCRPLSIFIYSMAWYYGLGWIMHKK